MTPSTLPLSPVTPLALEVLTMGSLLVELIPEGAGESVTDMTRLVPMPSGAAANFALALAALGVRVALLTRVGDDDLGSWLRRRLEQAGLDTTFLAAVPGQLTPVSFASADLRGGKRFTFYRFPGYSDPMATLSPASLDGSPLGRASLGRVRLFDFSEAVIRQDPLRATAFQLAAWCRDTGGHVVYAVNYRPQSWTLPLAEIAAVQRQAIALADVALMNEEEYALIFGDDAAAFPTSSDGRTLGGSGAPAPLLVVTAGDRGGWIQSGPTREPFPAHRVPVHYDVGAGDTFHAGYVAAFLQGQSPSTAARFAAACAALKITRGPSAPPPTRAEVEAFLREP